MGIGEQGGTCSVHAETKKRDQTYVMSGHHCHQSYELFYVHQGACRFLIADGFFDLRAGDFILIPPLFLHYTRYMFGPCTRTVVMFDRRDVTGEVMRAMPQAEQLFSAAAVFRAPQSGRGRLEACLEQMEAEERVDDGCSGPLRRFKLQELLLLCARSCDFLPGRPNDLRTTDSHVLKAARYISDNYMQPLTTEDVAGAVGFSPSYLSRRFRSSAGIGLHEYIVFVRLQHAARELLETADSITTIALRCGFSDSNYFKDSFKKKFGVTPRDYRKL